MTFYLIGSVLTYTIGFILLYKYKGQLEELMEKYIWLLVITFFSWVGVVIVFSILVLYIGKLKEQ